MDSSPAAALHPLPWLQVWHRRLHCGRRLHDLRVLAFHAVKWM
uniref:Uncharacterized protein n=1 Tax=Arundo donax TaxID=35708 RepID=A0A0A9BAN2_ARUDO